MIKMPVSLIVFTILSGLSAGIYICLNLIAILSPKVYLLTMEEPLTIACLILMGISMLASATHLEKPFRFSNALSNPRSMITQEGYWGPLFAVVLFAASFCVFFNIEPWLWLRIIGSLVALTLLVITSLVYVKAKGIPAWNDSGTIFTFLFSALLMGSIVCTTYLYADPELEQAFPISAILVLIFFVLRAITVIATEVRISIISASFDIPRLTGMKAANWIIGIIIPMICLFILLNGSVSWIPGILATVAIIAGETISRIVFFQRGIHKKVNSSMW